MTNAHESFRRRHRSGDGYLKAAIGSAPSRGAPFVASAGAGSDGRADPAIDREHGTGHVGSCSRGEEHGSPRHVVGRPIRRSGAASAIASPKDRSVAAIIFDSNGPGAMALTVMCLGPSSLASTRVRWCRPALLAEYAYV